MSESANGPFHVISHDNNMAVMRYVLSFLVVIAHTAILAGVELPLSNHSYVAVGGFFAYSGFLLFSSYQQKPLFSDYISKRSRRILPPYFLIVILCALTLWSVSDLSITGYFSSPQLWKYLCANLSFMNFICPDLPGVFQGGEFFNSAVNGSLWTMKGEVLCYVTVPFLCMVIFRHPKFAKGIIIITIALCVMIRYYLYSLGVNSGREVFFTLEKQFGTMFIYFYSGALINLLYPEFLKFKWWIIAVDLAIMVFSDYFPEAYHLWLRPFVISSSVIWLSQVGKWGYFLRRHDDLSYDIYLFHYPIIQLIVWSGLPGTQSPYVILLLVAAATTSMAYISWNLIGRHFSLRAHARRHTRTL